MIDFTTDQNRFIHRTVAIMLHKGKALLHKVGNETHWSLPGGRVEFGESAKTGVIREMKEELGLDLSVERLVWVVENFFEDRGKNCHEVGMYFLLSTPAGCPLLSKGEEFMGKEGKTPLFFQWVDLKQLGNLPLYPSFLKKSLLNLPHTTQHIVHETSPDK